MDGERRHEIRADASIIGASGFCRQQGSNPPQMVILGVCAENGCRGGGTAYPAMPSFDQRAADGAPAAAYPAEFTLCQAAESAG